MDLAAVRRRARLIKQLAEGGMDTFTARWLLAGFVIPVLQLLKEVERMSTRWRTLSEAMRESGYTANYFEKPMTSLGGVSRLQHWRSERLADQTLEGLWLIHPSKVAEARAERESADQAASGPGSAIDIEAIVDEMTRDRDD